MERYDRQMRVANIGEIGQEKLLSKTILIVGVGAIGSYAAEICARMGFGKLILIDRDYVELSNLQRQSLYTELDALEKQAKAYAAQKALLLINSEIEVEYIVDDANMTSLTPFAKKIDYILDCTDNFMTRDFLNQFCFIHQIPWIFTSCAGNYANLMPIIPPETACLHCLLGDIPQTNAASCDIVGVDGALIPIVAGMQVSLLTQMILNPDFTANTYYQIDNWQLNFQSLVVKKRPHCKGCSPEKVRSEVPFSKQTIALCGRDTVQFHLQNKSNYREIKQRLAEQKMLYTENPALLSFNYEKYQFVIFKNGRVLLHGTENLAEAKKIYQLFFN
ncbi:ThiF family adenylyltransferase [Listeria innocua]|uniref:ThiF family adenylyltransferase n=1 Tax=Listeria innocua TaxID=1642 RepID=UPI0005F0C326|nr:ThiF family adenylyltransferase [Listeria innocua]EAE6207073.1 molybdopterin biosynthesis protein MoeB [Listeria innocua]EEP3925862.1 molybdopterin biosynthesis protein MoeB [Listeria innocua]EIX7077667.1 ThiF family adenylyltransferase [Listeria innocua]EIX7079266.1 ThiF family adenylyltransferase [Listeria innocua]EIX7083341.1 ThiF family adenylyltransferase [Listeria innocua]